MGILQNIVGMGAPKFVGPCLAKQYWHS